MLSTVEDGAALLLGCRSGRSLFGGLVSGLLSSGLGGIGGLGGRIFRFLFATLECNSGDDSAESENLLHFIIPFSINCNGDSHCFNEGILTVILRSVKS